MVGCAGQKWSGPKVVRHGAGQKWSLFGAIFGDRNRAKSGLGQKSTGPKVVFGQKWYLPVDVSPPHPLSLFFFISYSFFCLFPRQISKPDFKVPISNFEGILKSGFKVQTWNLEQLPRDVPISNMEPRSPTSKFNVRCSNIEVRSLRYGFSTSQKMSCLFFFFVFFSFSFFCFFLELQGWNFEVWVQSSNLELGTLVGHPRARVETWQLPWSGRVQFGYGVGGVVRQMATDAMVWHRLSGSGQEESGGVLCHVSRCFGSR